MKKKIINFQLIFKRNPQPISLDWPKSQVVAKAMTRKLTKK